MVQELAKQLSGDWLTVMRICTSLQMVAFPMIALTCYLLNIFIEAMAIWYMMYAFHNLNTDQVYFDLSNQPEALEPRDDRILG